MIRGLPTLERLIRRLQKMPYLASKNVYKVAAYFIASSEQQIDEFCATLKALKREVRFCNICFHWAEGDALCELCRQPGRARQLVCVVETSHDLLAIEKAGGFQGVYHVLGGALSPLDGIGPEQLAIEPLLARARSGDIQELIFATNPTPEGEATASYIATKLVGTNVATSKLASGVPTGSSLEYMDRVTIYKALAGRRPF